MSRLKFLSYIYAIDICAYAVMSNHYHVVLHVDKERALSWGLEEVAERWMQLYKGNILVNRWLQAPDTVSKAEMEKITECIELWRTRLYDIGWFMRGVNETIARMANNEESCKGLFWERRFKSQALLDEAALLSCMAYVDLNPVRAALPFTREEYFELVDTTGRMLRDDKRGAIAEEIPAIVARIGIEPDMWLKHIQKFGLTYGYCAGSSDNIVEFSQKFERKWARGVGGSERVYSCVK